MELDPFDKMLLVPNTHDDSRHALCLGPRSNIKAVGQGLTLYYERVIPCGFEGIRKASEKGIAVMMDHRGLSMHQIWRADDVSAESCPYCLMPQTYA